MALLRPAGWKRTFGTGVFALLALGQTAVLVAPSVFGRLETLPVTAGLAAFAALPANYPRPARLIAADQPVEQIHQQVLDALRTTFGD